MIHPNLYDRAAAEITGIEDATAVWIAAYRPDLLRVMMQRTQALEAARARCRQRVTVAELLAAARDRISEPWRFTPDAPARAIDGTIVEPTDPHAVAWSVLGAIAREAHERHAPARVTTRAYRLIMEQARVMWRAPIWWVEEYTTHDDVIGLFHRALRVLSERGKGDA